MSPPFGTINFLISLQCLRVSPLCGSAQTRICSHVINLTSSTLEITFRYLGPGQQPSS